MNTSVVDEFHWQASVTRHASNVETILISLNLIMAKKPADATCGLPRS